MPRVLVGPPTLIGLQAEFKTVLEAAGFELIFPPRNVAMTEAELLERLSGCEAGLVGSEPYTRRVFAAHPQLKIIARSGVGYDAVDIAAATDHGVPVAISPGNAEGVAEHTFALMLALSKCVFEQHVEIVAGGWPRRSNLPLRGQTLAILGLGRIGREVAKRALAFEMKVIAHDPVPNHAFAQQYGIPFVSAEESYARGDFVSLHYPLSAATHRGVDQRVLSLMKPTAYLINTARGGIVDETALTEHLGAGRIAGAGLDVLEFEPPAKDNPIFKLPNVIFTAHTAGVDTASRDKMALIAAQTIVKYCRGEWPGEVIVNPESRR